MTSALVAYMTKRRVIGSEGRFNMTTLYSREFQNGKYFISEADRNEFIDIYYKHVFVDKLGSTILECPFKETNEPYIKTKDSEPLTDCNLVKIDLDLQHELTKEENSSGVPIRRYSLEDMEMLIKSYVDKLKVYIHIPKDFQFYLLEKEKPVIADKNGKRFVKDGVHIISSGHIVPNAILHKVRQEIIDDADIIEMFADNIKPLTPLKQVIDEAVIHRNNWFLYGSGKPNDMVYKVSHIYSINTSGKMRAIDVPADDVSLIKAMSHLYASNSVKVRDVAGLADLTAKAGIQQMGSEMNTRIKKELRKLGSGGDLKGPKSEVFSAEYLKKLVDCLSPARAMDYIEWWKLGQALYNIDCRNGNLFIDFSRRAKDKFNEESCIDHWLTKFPKDSVKYSSLYIQYIRKLAKADNPVEYEKIESILSIKVVDEILNTFRQSIYEKKLGETTLSKLIKKFLDTSCIKQFVCVVGDKGARQWFVYENNRWLVDKGGVHIQKQISNEVLITFIKTNSNLHLEASNIHSNIVSQKTAEITAQRPPEERSDYSGEEDIRGLPDNRTSDNTNLQLEHSQYMDKAKIAERIVIHLEETRNRDTLIKNLGFLYNDSDFYSKIDTNPHVFVCKNGVLDLKELVFRQGQPEDLTTKSCLINYITMDDIVASPELQEASYQLQDFLDQVLPDPEKQNYFLNIVAECLSGVVRREEAYINEGTGSNGKSKIFDLLELVFGQYAGKTNIALFTNRRDSANSPSPAIVELCGKRLVSCQEPDEGSKLSTGILKELSGGDKLTGRDLNMPLKTFTPSHRIFMMCNDKPTIDSTDDGTWRRMRNIRFDSKFVEHDDERLLDPVAFPNHFKKDPRIPEKFAKWAPILLNNLFERYKNLARTNFNTFVPECVLSAIREYKADHNIYASFVREKIVKSVSDKLDVKAAFSEFVVYSKESNFKVGSINKNVFQTNIERILGAGIKAGKSGKWKGFMLTTYNSQETQDSETDTDASKAPASKKKAVKLAPKDAIAEVDEAEA